MNEEEKELTEIETKIQSGNLDTYGVRTAVWRLGRVIEEQPELATKCFPLFEKVLQSDQNTDYTLRDAYEELKIIAGRQPELTASVLKTMKIAFQSKANNPYSISYASDALSNIHSAIVYKHTARPKDLLSTLNTLMQSYGHDFRNDSSWVCEVFRISSAIAQHNPELAQEAFKTMETAMKLPDGGTLLLNDAYPYLGNIAIARPELGDEVLETFGKALKSQHNISDTRMIAYSVLGKMADEQPILADKVLSFIDKKLSDKEKNDINNMLNSPMKKNQEALLTQKITNKLVELKEKTQVGRIADIPHLETQVLRAVGEDNLGKPKRSKAEKDVIKLIIEKSMQIAKK